MTMENSRLCDYMEITDFYGTWQMLDMVCEVGVSLACKEWVLFETYTIVAVCEASYI
jgi:hypothetical protein